ncbi:MAG: hypothetical protein CM15mP122_4070 [Bacteroidota bacterium]|nr:MAG: hypothetical protein CM15mP122_4070 [Bacteroidota bacterium]
MLVPQQVLFLPTVATAYATTGNVWTPIALATSYTLDISVTPLSINGHGDT